MLPLDLPALGVDVYAFPGHKWLCGSPAFVGTRGLTFSREGVVTGAGGDELRFAALAVLPWLFSTKRWPPG